MRTFAERSVMTGFDDPLLALSRHVTRVSSAVALPSNRPRRWQGQAGAQLTMDRRQAFGARCEIYVPVLASSWMNVPAMLVASGARIPKAAVRFLLTVLSAPISCCSRRRPDVHASDGRASTGSG